jgi:riboflavin biosynthesis pyrimidine reductase
MTHDSELLKKDIPGALFTDKIPAEVLNLVEKKGFSEVMLIGGMQLDTSFIKENLVDEIWLSIHPLLIGDGLAIIDKLDCFKNLTFLGLKQLDEGLVQLRYKLK